MTTFITIVCVLCMAFPFFMGFLKLYKVKLNPKDSSWDKVIQEYRSTLGKSIPVKTLTEANSIVDVESLYASNNINYLRLKSLPNTLVGLGILGTFLGLSVALLADLNLADTETTITSVHALLSGMKTAFFTSVFGMFFSIVFGVGLRSHIHKLQSLIAKTCIQLDAENLTSAASALYENNRLIITQNELLLKLGESIGDSIGERITTAFTISSQRLETQLVKQNTLMEQTSENVAMQLEMSSNNLKEIFTEQNVVIKNMANNLGSSVKNVVTDELKNSFKELMDAITTKISSELVEAASKLKECTEHLSNSASTLQNGSTSIDNSSKGLNDAANNLGLSAESISDYTAELQARADMISNNIDKLNQTVSEIGDVSNQFSAAAVDATNSINGISAAVEKINFDRIHSKITEFTKTIDFFTKELNELSDLVGKLPNADKIIQEISSATNAYISTLHESVNELTKTYTGKFTEACDSINGTIRKMDNTMSSAKGDTEESVKRIVLLITRATENLNKAVISLSANDTQKQ